VAANTGKKSELKRDEVKYLRDKAKARYPKGTCCAICDTTENLEFHHYSSLTLLWEKWKVTTGVSIDDVDDVIFHRDTFIAEHEKELYEDAVTLCNEHHVKLHTIYGSKPALHTATKQANWVKIQYGKLHKD
jgi:hypothetical protein